MLRINALGWSCGRLAHRGGAGPIVAGRLGVTFEPRFEFATDRQFDFTVVHLDGDILRMDLARR